MPLVTYVSCYTSATLSYLDRVAVLFATLKRHQPTWKRTLCLVDRVPEGFPLGERCPDADEVVTVHELGLLDLDRWLFMHDVVEACTALKGPMLCRLLAEGADQVIYLDPDIAVFHSLDTVTAEFRDHDVLLTPHQLEPEQGAQAEVDNELRAILQHGVFNLGFLGVANTEEGNRFARWWLDKLLRYCYAESERGLFTDQRWCDLVPALFPSLGIVRDPGCNVASWNLSRRLIQIEESGSILVEGSPLKFFHFTKFAGDGAMMLERYSRGRIEVFELMAWYRRQLVQHHVPEFPDGRWAFGTYRDGTMIPLADRRLYRDRNDLQRAIPNPFVTSGIRARAEHREDLGSC